MSNGKTKWSAQWIAVELLIMALIGLIFGFLGPFGTYAMPVALRLAYWVGFIIVGYAIFRPVSISAGWLRESIGISVWAAELMATAVATLPLTFLIGFAISGMRFDPDFLGDRFVLLYLQCGAIGFGIFLFMRLLFGPDEAVEQADHDLIQSDNRKIVPASEPIKLVRTQLHDRLPQSFPGMIIALGVEDHYVRVHAAERTEMLLLRLSDAIKEMEPQEGMQVHRSWWVARDAIVTSKREGRNLRLSLSGGLEVPVSRAYVTKLKQTGWI
ncbi:LytTR family DNA-binding domain-containing protein [Parasphingorhabdus cellanae]|uniref:LytTR family transcriptional regulator n=1 Tax=Parasphingorhabdus cellanae TaxID=2806553 RepID=A0ABX7SZX2_9SPHN|nr:LytTR family DNA-binding domain-containing protein [Parasphingorhabdus cellanae]QTD54829.1 LytTR family transcriptional regulator [Parasphingorhabdus cellanae]